MEHTHPFVSLFIYSSIFYFHTSFSNLFIDFEIILCLCCVLISRSNRYFIYDVCSFRTYTHSLFWTLKARHSIQPTTFYLVVMPRNSGSAHSSRSFRFQFQWIKVNQFYFSQCCVFCNHCILYRNCLMNILNI